MRWIQNLPILHRSFDKQNGSPVQNLDGKSLRVKSVDKIVAKSALKATK